MSKFNVTENSNEWINLIEKSIAKNCLKFYEYNRFSNIKEIGSGSSGKVYHVNWENSHLTLKSFFDLNHNTVKELIREVII